MKQSDHFRENAENCAQLAERASDEPTYLRYNAWKPRGVRWRMNKIGWMALSHQT